MFATHALCESNNNIIIATYTIKPKIFEVEKFRGLRGLYIDHKNLVVVYVRTYECAIICGRGHLSSRKLLFAASARRIEYCWF